MHNDGPIMEPVFSLKAKLFIGAVALVIGTVAGTFLSHALRDEPANRINSYTPTANGTEVINGKALEGTIITVKDCKNEFAMHFAFNVGAGHGNTGHEYIMPLEPDDIESINNEYPASSDKLLMIAGLNGVTQMAVMDDGISINHDLARDPEALRAKIDQIIGMQS